MGEGTDWCWWSRLENNASVAVKLLLVHLQNPHTQIRRVGHPESRKTQNLGGIMLRSRLKIEGRMLGADVRCLPRLASMMTPTTMTLTAMTSGFAFDES
jgi:hypothetical protein